VIFLPSFIIVKVPSRKLDAKAIQAQVNRLSAFESKTDYRQGTLPDTFRHSHGCVSFKIGFDYDDEIEQLDGSETVRRAKKFHVVFIGDNFIAIENTHSEDDLEWIQRFLESNFVEEVVLESIPFDERVLRRIAENNPDVFEIEHTPTRKGMEAVDRLRYTGRGVTHSKIYQDYGEEPLAKIKVRLNEITEGVTVAFYKDGKVTVFREADTDKLNHVLKLIVDKIVAPYVAQTSFQRKLL
jgi:hypothetical protein